MANTKVQFKWGTYANIMASTVVEGSIYFATDTKQIILDKNNTHVVMYTVTATQSADGMMSSTDKAKLDGIAEGATANTGTVTSVATGVGLAGGPVTSTGTVKAALVSETKLTNAASAATETAGRVYPVAVDKNGKLAVNVPWTDTTTGTTADSLTNTRTFSITGAATAAAQNFNGTQNVALNVTSLDATKLSGTVPIANLPASALERVVTVANDTARFALTLASVQVGDVVKVTDTGKMYFVTDDTELSSEAGYTEFSAGIASKATYDASDNKIDETYIKNITRSGNTFTATRGDDTTFTFTQADNDSKTAQALTSTNANYPLLFGNSTTSTTTATVTEGARRNNSVYVNPSTGTVTATNFAGNVNGHTVSADVPADAEFTDTTYSAATNGGLSLSGTEFSIANSGATAGSYGPSAAVTGTNNTTINVPYITVNAKGQVTSIENKVYTSKDTTYGNATTSVAGLMSAADKTKLDGLESLTWQDV